MEDKEKQSRESETQIIELRKDIDHITYILNQYQKEITFIKDHFSTKNAQRIDDINKLDYRMDKHIDTELKYHQAVRDKICEEHKSIHKRIANTERWIWIFFGGFTVVGALLGKASMSGFFN